jgi:hypothetical protein
LFVAGIFFFLIIRSEGDILALLAQSRDSVFFGRDIIFERICVASTTHAPLMTHVEFTVRNDRAEIGFDLRALAHECIIGCGLVSFKEKVGIQAVVSACPARVYARSAAPAKMAVLTPCGARTYGYPISFHSIES